MAPKAPSLPDIMVPRRTLAQVCDLSTGRINQLCRDGTMERAAQDRYPLIRCTNGYINFLRTENKRSSTQGSAGLVAAARTKEIEQRVAIRQNQLIALAEHDAIFVEAFGVVKSCFARLPACVDPDLRGKVAAEIDAIFADAEAAFRKAGTAVRATGPGSGNPPKG